MATASWLDPSTRAQRLMSKEEIQNMPLEVHHKTTEEVNSHRLRGCELIIKIGEGLRMYQPALSCACVLFSRFYSRNGFGAPRPSKWSEADWKFFQARLQKPDNRSWMDRKLSPEYVAVASLFVAGKIEDNPKKVADLSRQFHYCMKEEQEHGQGGIGAVEWTDFMQRSLRDAILAYEQLILQELEFDMIVEAPVALNQMALLIKYIGRIKMKHEEEERKDIIHTLVDLGREDLKKEALEMLSVAKRFVEDSLLTTLWLQYDASTIAIGVVWMTLKFYGYAGEHGWWGRVEKQWRELNTKRDLDFQTGVEVVKHTMEVPSRKVLEDVGDRIVQYYIDRRRAPFPPEPLLPDAAMASSDGWTSQGFRDPSDAGGVDEEAATWIRMQDGVASCSCPAWRGQGLLDESIRPPENKRTCRCLVSFLGGRAELRRVEGPQNLRIGMAACGHVAEARRKRKGREGEGGGEGGRSKAAKVEAEIREGFRV